MSKPTGVVNIRGREYETVALRVQKFRDKYTNWTLATEVLHRDSESVVIKATISDDQGRLKATGHAEEYRKASQINKTSALENAETSAIGRALAALGLGGTEFASAEEVANAIHQQGVHRPSDGAWEVLTEEEQIKVRDLAMTYINMMAQNQHTSVLDALDETGLSAEEKIALWSLLGSKDRALLKKLAAERKKVAA